MRLIHALPLALVVAGCDASAPEPVAEQQTAAPVGNGIVVADAWVRLPPVAGRPGAGYFTIRSGAATRIESVTSPKVERIELHESSMEGNVMRMGPLEDRSVPAGAELRFAPGGNHAMLFGIADDVAPGGTIPLTFTFEGGQQVSVEARTEAAGGGAPAH